MEVQIIGFSSKNQTPGKMIIFHEDKITIDWKSCPFPEENEESEEKVKINFCDSTGENKTLKENCVVFLKKLTLNLRHQALHNKME